MSATAKPETNGAALVPLRQREPLPDEVVLAIAAGNLTPLPPAMKALAIRAICEDGGMPPSLAPVILIPGDGGTLRPYVTANGAAWVADNKKVSTKILETGTAHGVYFVRMLAVAGDGRTVEDIGAVAVQGLVGQNLANAWMKATTKGYRRAVLRLAGLPLTDDDEGTGPPRRIDYETGELLEGEATVVEDDPQKPMRKIHATAQEKTAGDAHKALHALARAVYGVPSMTLLSSGQLAALQGAVDECGDADDLTDLVELAAQIDAAQDAGDLMAAGLAIGGLGLGPARNQVLRVAFKRVQQALKTVAEGARTDDGEAAAPPPPA